MKKIELCVFDAYGTLFDVNSACRQLSKEVGEKWIELSKLWRLRQIEYTWLRNSMKIYKDFWLVTEDALDYAMEMCDINDENLKFKLLDLYFKLEPYTEVKGILEKLKKMNYKTAILSNGSPNMLMGAVENAEISEYIDKIISVDICKRYKPSHKVYDLIEKEFKIKRDYVAFYSSNAWDMHAASNYGFKTIWVNRFDGKLERLPGKPNFIVKNLNDIITELNK